MPAFSIGNPFPTLSLHPQELPRPLSDTDHTGDTPYERRYLDVMPCIKIIRLLNISRKMLRRATSTQAITDDTEIVKAITHVVTDTCYLERQCSRQVRYECEHDCT